jgi:hypothetical protein
MIYEVHRKVENNIGDYYCNPSRYFKFENLTTGELMHNKFPIKNNTLIVGGGGLIHKKFQLHIKDLLDKKPKHSVLWGIGHNFGKKHVEKQSNDVYYPDWTKRVSLPGIRDYIPGYLDMYLPCVSCMHSAFDKKYKIQHDHVYFTHAFKSKYEYKDGDVHLKNNEKDFDKVIEFLGSANTIITDSYHGAYWGQLLGRDVRVISWSVKFNHMKHTPSFAEDIFSWNTTSSPSHIPNGFLEECRDLNTKFYNKFLNLLD